MVGFSNKEVIVHFCQGPRCYAGLGGVRERGGVREGEGIGAEAEV